MTRQLACIIGIIFLCAGSTAAKDFDIAGIISFAIPSEFEGLAHQVSFSRHEPSQTYNVSIVFTFVYEDFRLEFTMRLRGRRNIDSLQKRLAPGREIMEQYNQYNDGIMTLLLDKASTMENPPLTPQDCRIIREWGSGHSSDVTGYYSPLRDDTDFDQVFIIAYNTWGNLCSAPCAGLSDETFPARLEAEASAVKRFYRLLDGMISSIEFHTRRTDAVRIELAEANAPTVETVEMLATAEGLLLRKGPGLKYPVITIVNSHIPYRVQAEGPETIIDGIKGKWLKIYPWFGKHYSGWAFSAYLRRLTPQELMQFGE